MSESKSKIMSFRLSAELEAAASAAASAAGDKNASAWCQRLAVEVLSKMGESTQNENAEGVLEAAFAKDLLKALSNIRQLNLDCFKMSLKNEEQYKEFLNIVIASEEEWETINQNVGKPELEFSMAANEPTVAAKSPTESEILSKEKKASEGQTAAEEISDEYLSFAEEMQNEVAELVGGEREFMGFQNNRAFESDESALKNQVPVVLPIRRATERTDAGKSF